MKKVVLTIREDVCAKHNKDVNATELLGVMSHYGTVEDYDTALAKNNAEYQSNIESLNAQLNAIKEQELTVDEIKMVKSYRENKSSVVSAYVAEAEQYKSQLQAVKNEHEQRVAKLKAILGDE